VDSDYLFDNFLQLPVFRSPRPRNPSPFSAELLDGSKAIELRMESLFHFLSTVEFRPRPLNIQIKRELF
jgi:hypothetical protein